LKKARWQLANVLAADNFLIAWLQQRWATVTQSLQNAELVSICTAADDVRQAGPAAERVYEFANASVAGPSSYCRGLANGDSEPRPGGRRLVPKSCRTDSTYIGVAICTTVQLPGEEPSFFCSSTDLWEQ
jgi:hypothetical protein